MNVYLLFFLIGLGAGIPIFLIWCGVYVFFRNVIERRKIKKMINNGQFLTCIDVRDYDSKAWAKYIASPSESEVKSFNKKLFKKTGEAFLEEEFVLKLKDYVSKARELRFRDEEIVEEFKRKGYTPEIINKVFEKDA